MIKTRTMAMIKVGQAYAYFIEIEDQNRINDKDTVVINSTKAW